MIADSSSRNQRHNEAPPFLGDFYASEAMNIAEGVRRGAVAQHDERRRKTMRATRFRRAALFAERPVGTGKKVKGREIDVAPWFYTGPCASKAANHWQATAPRRAPVAKRHGRLSAACCWMCESRSDAKTRQFGRPSRNTPERSGWRGAAGCAKAEATPRPDSLGDLRETPRSVPAGGVPQATVRASPETSARSAFGRVEGAKACPRWGVVRGKRKF